MSKKTLIYMIIFITVFFSFLPLSLGCNVWVSNIEQPSVMDNGDILYVGGDGHGNYSKIQYAINNASSKDTIFVYDDSSPYYENVVINKDSINLIGEDKNTTIIDGGKTGTVVKLDFVSGVIIDGFTIQNSGSSWDDAGIGGSFLGSSINSNIISNNTYGIENIFITGYPGMGDNEIFDNIIINNIYSIKIESSFNKVYDNHIVNNNGGIKIEPHALPTNNRLFLLTPTDNEVYRNTISDNNYYAIDISHSDKNQIFENNIKNNGDGIRISGFENGINNNIYKNNILYNKKGININCQRESGYNNKVYQNNFFGNKRNAYFVGNNKNTWDENYWNRPRDYPYPIIGLITPFESLNIFIPWFQIDYNPAKEPYDIDGYIILRRIT